MAKNKQAKPGEPHAYVWKYFQTYIQTQLQCYAICKLCVGQEQLGRAEVSNKGSPTNLKTQVNTQYPGYQKAYDEVQRKMGRSIGAGAYTGNATLAVQQTIEQFFGSRTNPWH